jgi:hypothetical protein
VNRTACVMCGTDLEQPTTGRPRTYCGPVCRRAAEYELRRLQRQLEGAEQSVLVARRNVEFGPASPHYQRRRLAFERQRLADLEVRLRTLLGDLDVRGEPK